jgi:hypothetical protein
MDAFLVRASPVCVRRAQRGQAMVFVLGLAAALAATFVLSYGVGETVARKQRLLDAADAAAFGAATWQARSLNFQAYSNRAIVANEVALGQAVSLRSWSDYMARTLTNVNTVTQFVPYLGQVTNAIKQAWDAVDDVVQASMQAIEATAAIANGVLAGAQPIVHAAGFVAAEQIARETLPAFGSDVAPSTANAALVARNAAEWVRFTTTYSGNDRTRLRDVVHDGRDGFTRSRGARIAPMPASLVVRLEKRGGTEIVGFDTWRGIDTLAIHRRGGFLGLGAFRESVPIGWGGAQNALRPSQFRGDHGGAWAVNPRTARLAEGRLNANNGRTYAGLPATRDVASPRVQTDRELRFVVEAADRADDPVTGARGMRVRSIGGPRSDASFETRSVPHALSVASVRFERPEGRADRRREYGSLYSPYWVARLAPPTSTERAIAAAVRGEPNPFAGLAP